MKNRKIEKIIRKFEIGTNPQKDDTILKKVLDAQKEHKDEPESSIGLNIACSILQNPVSRWAALVIILAGLFFSANLVGGQIIHYFQQKQAATDSNDITQTEHVIPDSNTPGRIEPLAQVADESAGGQSQQLIISSQQPDESLPENPVRPVVEDDDSIAAIESNVTQQQPLEISSSTTAAEPNEISENLTGLTGIVVEKGTNTPIEGAVVGAPPIFSAYSDEEGKFTLIIPDFLTQGMPEGYSEEAEMLASASNYAAKIIFTTIKKGKLTDITIELDPGSMLTGLVTDSNGLPISDAEVEVYYSMPVFTDINGIFEIDTIDPTDSTQRIRVEHPLYPQVSVDFQPAPAGQSVYKEITLQSGIIVFGQVTDSNGNPAVAVTVGNTTSGSMWNVKKSITDAEGMYILDGVDPGELTLWTSSNQYPPYVLNTTIAPEQSQHQIDISLPEPTELKGYVLDNQSNPIQGTSVYMHEYNGVSNIDHNTMPCDANGFFIIPNAPGDGDLILYTSGSNIVSTRYNVDFSLPEQIIIAERPGMIYGQVLDASTGLPIQKFLVRMTFTQTGNIGSGYNSFWREPGCSFSSEDGYFDTRSENLTVNANYRITVSAAGYDPVTDDLALVQPISDNPERTMFLLEPSTLRVGRVISSNGRPIEGAKIVLYPSSISGENPILLRDITDEEGIYSFLELGSEYKIMEVNSPDYTPNMFFLEDIMQPDGQFTDIILDHGVTLYGYAFDENGNGVADVDIYAYLDISNTIRTAVSTKTYTSTTDNDGFYQISGVPAAEMMVTASSHGYSQRKKVNVIRGQNTELNFADEEGFIISGTITDGGEPLENARIILASDDREILRMIRTDAQGRFKSYFFKQESYNFVTAWATTFLEENNTQWPEDTYFNLERQLEVEGDMELEIDLQNNIVRDSRTGGIIEDSQ